jgi:hypothetical protein
MRLNWVKFFAWDDIVPHENLGSKTPAGGKHRLHGSADWITLCTMLFFYQNTGGFITRRFFGCQDSTDF